MPIEKALACAEIEDLDLVKVSSNAKPPVCKIVDFGKFRYEQERREKEAKKKQKTIETKEIRMSPNIDENDFNTKVTSARKFIEKGDKVKVALRFHGREVTHMKQSEHLLNDFAKRLEDIAAIEKPPKTEGKNIIMLLGKKK